MPSYLYHLKFELYPSRDPASSDGTTAASNSRSGVWLPPPGTNIFDELPVHPVDGKRPALVINRSHSFHDEVRQSAPSAAPLAHEPSVASPAVIDCGSPRPPKEDNQSILEVIPERLWRQRTRSLPPPPASAALTPQTAAGDWRFGSVSIETIDLAGSDSRMAGETSRTGASAAPSLGPDFGGAGTSNRAECLVLRSHNTEVGWGVVHFYREGDETPSLREVDGEFDTVTTEKDDDFTTLCIPAVPAYMTAGDFLGFVGERWREDISHCRMVMTSKMNRYLVLLKFRSGKRAKQWRHEFDGRVFNSMEVRVSQLFFHAALSKTSVAPSLSRRLYQEHHLRDTITVQAKRKFWHRLTAGLE